MKTALPKRRPWVHRDIGTDADALKAYRSVLAKACREARRKRMTNLKIWKFLRRAGGGR